MVASDDADRGGGVRICVGKEQIWSAMAATVSWPEKGDGSGDGDTVRCSSKQACGLLRRQWRSFQQLSPTAVRLATSAVISGCFLTSDFWMVETYAWGNTVLWMSHSSHVELTLKKRAVDHGIWHLMTFKSINSTMEQGVIKQLDFEDLLQLPSDMDPSSCLDMLLSCWQTQQRNNCSNPSFFKVIFTAYGWPYLRLGMLKVLNDCIGFVGPLLLNKLIQFLQQGSWSFDGYILAISLGLTSILKSFLDTQYTFHLARLKLKLRSGIMAVIYRKCLHVSMAERSKFSEGEIQTFMSVDADRVVNLFNSFHDTWSLPFQIGVALYLLYTQVKYAFLSGIAITILLIPVNKWIAKLIASATTKMMEQKDES